MRFRFFCTGLCLLGLLSGSLLNVGCEMIAATSYAFEGGEPVKKIYALPQVKTVVLVDTLEEPGQRNELASPTYRNIIVSDINYYLEFEEALTPEQIIPLKELSNLVAVLGDDFAVTPIDEIGRRVGAEQVIYVTVDESTLLAAGELYRPMAYGQVKVIDVERGRRTFPRMVDLEEDGAGGPGHAYEVKLDPSSNNSGSASYENIVARELAKEVGLTVSRLFYDWEKPDLGSQIK